MNSKCSKQLKKSKRESKINNLNFSNPKLKNNPNGPETDEQGLGYLPFTLFVYP